MRDMPYTERMLEACASENPTVRKCLDAGDITLDDLLLLQAGKVRGNMGVKPLRSSDDLRSQAERITREKLGDRAAEDVAAALRSGGICTADHHGAIFCAQSFQGDILYSLLLKKLGYRGRYVPVFAASQVELENATYARGVCVNTHPSEKVLLPIFPAKYSVTLASHADPVNEEMLGRFRKRFIEGDEISDEAAGRQLRPVLDSILKSGYGSEKAKKCSRFADQVSIAGAALSELLFKEDDAPLFVYIENEEVIKPVLYEELKEEGSLISRILYDERTRSAFVAETTEDGVSFGGLLFRSVDEKGRKILLSLTEDGKLTGRDWRKETVEYDIDPDTLIHLMDERKLIPGTFTCALISFFERGITWFGGMFQSCYLPVWQRDFTGFLRGMGLTDEAEVIEAYDCSGYISGPMFDMYRGDGYATVAGPVEYAAKRRSYEGISQALRRVTLKDAHRIGLSEMYFDLVPRDLREEDWYEKTARELAVL